MDNLLARFAENSFWMARYMERAENLARILDVNETFAQNSEGVKEWLPIVQLYADADRFFDGSRARRPRMRCCISTCSTARTRPRSSSTVAMARENARTLRHLISTETWTHLNVFYNRLQKLQRSTTWRSPTCRALRPIKEDCQLHTGIIEGTGYRDQGWYVYQIGK